MADKAQSLPPLKDWRDAESYPDVERLTNQWRIAWEVTDERLLSETALLSLWRWEFLRRRDDYRIAFAAQHERSQRYFDSLELQPDQRAALAQFGARHLSGLSRQFGLELVPAPEWEFRITLPPLFLRTYGFSTRSNGLHEGDETQKLIAFDTALPIKPQLEAARRFLEALQTEKHGMPLQAPRQHRAKWITYLRALDAHAAGETFATIWLDIGRNERPIDDPDVDDQDQAGARGFAVLDQAKHVQAHLTELAPIKNNAGPKT